MTLKGYRKLVSALLLALIVGGSALLIYRPARAVLSTAAGESDHYLPEKGLPLAEHGRVFVKSRRRGDVDSRLVVVIAGAETTFGKRACATYNPWNCFYEELGDDSNDLTFAGGPSPKPEVPVTPSPWDTDWIPSDHQAVAARIDSILAGSGLAGQGGTILNCALTLRDGLHQEVSPGLNPAFALAMFRKEAEFAKPSSIARRQHNPGNIRCKGGTVPLYGARRCQNGFGVYDTMADGIKAYFWLLNAEYKPGGVISRNCQDIACIITAYCPPSECDTTRYIAQVMEWTEQYQSQLSKEPLDALVLNAPVYDVVLPEEVAKITLEVQNAGTIPWRPAEHYALKAVGELREGVPNILPLEREVSPGETATWSLRFHVTGGWGLRRYNFRMHLEDAPFGPSLTIYVFILPEQLADMEERIRERIDEWQRRGEKEIEELFQEILHSIEEELERRLQSWLQEQLGKLERFLSELCVGPMALLLGVVVLWAERRR